MNINQTPLFDPIVTVEILRVPLSEKGTLSSTTQSLITKLIGYFNQINKANSALVKDEKNREIITRNDGDLVQINPIDFSPKEVKQLEKHLIE